MLCTLLDNFRILFDFLKDKYQICIQIQCLNCLFTSYQTSDNYKILIHYIDLIPEANKTTMNLI